MSIIGPSEAIHDAAAFQAGLEKATRGVVRVSIRPDRAASVGSFCTGWLITDRLVVVPDFVVRGEGGQTYSCEQGSQAIPADVIFGAVGEPDSSWPALLRLAEPLGDRSLPLARQAIKEGYEVFVLQHVALDQRLRLSFGNLVKAEESWLHYTADTLPGSSGAPVLNASWAIVGMHIGGVGFNPASPGRGTGLTNSGLSLTAMLQLLRESSAWEEIARHQKLADVAAIRHVLGKPALARPSPAQSTELVGAAVRWSFDPGTFPNDAVERLRPLVVEPSARRWTLSTNARASLLQSAGSLEALREARGTEVADHPGQQVIDRILRGPPYSLDEVPEQTLPYWLQATRWFAGILPSLPSPAEVNRTLERRRMRSRLEKIGGPGFRGRVGELDRLREWHRYAAAGPMVITGIGGVGKSALIARFALELPQEAVQLWLDFDRADIAPDDPVSVLRLLFNQLATQFEGFCAPTLDATSWPAAVSGLGPALAPHLNGASTPLLVLDGFEVAQHVKEHREIWRLLEQLLPQIPGLRVVVSGRAPIVDLELGGSPAHGIHLVGLSEADATPWLREAGIVDERVLARVVEITRGIPLSLRLAVRWVEAGGKIGELPAELPERLVDGFLYDRILDRVIDQRLKPIAQDALVLRRLTPEMIPVVLSDSSPEGLEAADVFARLTQEMALVGDGTEGQTLESPVVALLGTGVLRLRPEVRSATLRLLETDRPDRVRTIDQRAADWYAQQDLNDVANAAELIYHRLRLGDVAGAAQAWRDACAPLLLYADEELPEDALAARAWLRDRTNVAPTEANVLVAWENEAHDRVRALIARGVLQSVGPLLAERAKRGPASPLVLYDAWLHWALNDDVAGAREILLAAGDAEGTVGRGRAVLAAWLAAEAGDRPEADRQLLAVADPERWADGPEPELDALMVEAARVRLTIDAETELKLAEMLDGPYPISLGDTPLTPSDVITPFLANELGGKVLESTDEALHIPNDISQLDAFTLELDRLRGYSSGDMKLPISNAGGGNQLDVDLWDVDPWWGSELGLAQPPESDPARATALDLAVLGWRRWRLVTRSLFLAQACEVALGRDLGEPRRRSILGTLAAFATHERSSFILTYKHAGPLSWFLEVVVDIKREPSPSPRLADRRASLATRMLRLHGLSAESEAIARAHVSTAPGMENLILHLLSPDPLEVLVRRVIGVPDTLSVRGQP